MAAFRNSSVGGVLSRCARIEASASPKLSTAFANMRQDPGRALRRPGESMDPLEWQAQAAMVWARTRRTLSPQRWAVCRGWYVIPETPLLSLEREQCLAVAAEWLRITLSEAAACTRLPMTHPRARLATREWARNRGALSRELLARLSRRWDTSTSTVARALRNKRVGWWSRLTYELAFAEGDLEAEFEAAGWINPQK